jgi:putative membrane protein
LALAWLGPLPGLAPASFAAHMLMHMAVVAVGAPLIALGLTRLGLVPVGIPVALAMVASLLDMVVIWAWHAPVPHLAARGDPSVLVLEQGSFLAVGLFLWVTALSGRQAAVALAGAGALFFTSMHMTLLGVLLALAPPGFAVLCSSGILGLSPAADRELGGILMLAIGGAVYLVGGLALMAQALQAPKVGR